MAQEKGNDELQVEVPTDEEMFEGGETATETEEVKTEAPPVEAEPAEETTPEPVEPTEDGDSRERGGDHRVPLRELLDERERRQQVQSQVQAMQQQMAQQQQYQQQQAQAQQQQQGMPDIFEHPEYYQNTIAEMQQYAPQLQNHIQQQVNQQLAMARHEMMGEMSLMNARRKDPESYDAAWADLTKRVQGGDNTWRHQVLTSQDPGETLLELHKRESTYTNVGGDPDAYVNQRIEELKQDPKFLAEVLEAAQSMGGQPSSPKINLPPSLTKAGGTGANVGNTSISQSDLWDEINK